MVKSSQCDIYRRNMLYINSTLPVAQYVLLLILKDLYRTYVNN